MSSPHWGNLILTCVFKNAIFLFFFLADFKSVHPGFSTQHRHWRSCEGSSHAVLAAMLGQTVMFTKLLSLRQNDSTHLSSWQLRSGSCRYLLFSLVTNKKKNPQNPKTVQLCAAKCASDVNVWLFLNALSFFFRISCLCSFHHIPSV